MPYEDSSPEASALDTARRVAHNLRLEMLNAGLTQADLAPHLHMSQQAVSDRLRGRTPLTLHELDTLKVVFRLDSVTQLIEGRRLAPVDGLPWPRQGQVTDAGTRSGTRQYLTRNLTLLVGEGVQTPRSGQLRAVS